jgi:hypothetical protein
MCNLFISNVPGPQIPMYMNGARMVRSVGLAPLADGMGLFIGTPSYDGKMSFNVISTREVLPDIEFFMACLEASLAELTALARHGGDAAKPARATKAAPKARSAKGKRAAPAKPRAASRRKTASTGAKRKAAPAKKPKTRSR